MDLLDRRIARRLARDLGLDEADVIDFEMGTSRPHVALPPPLQASHDEQARIEVALTSGALHLRVTSRTLRGEAAAVPLPRLRSFGPHRAEGRWRRWSLRGELTDGTPLVVSLTGKPRPTFVEALTRAGVRPSG